MGESQVSTDVAVPVLREGPAGLPTQSLYLTASGPPDGSGQPNAVYLLIHDPDSPSSLKGPKENAHFLSNLQAFSSQIYGIDQTMGMAFH